MPWVLRRLLVAGGSVEVVDALMMLCSEMLFETVALDFLDRWRGFSAALVIISVLLARDGVVF